MSQESSTNNSNCEGFSQSQVSTPNSKGIKTSSIFKGSIRRYQHDLLSKEVSQFSWKESETAISSQRQSDINHGSLKERKSPIKSSGKVLYSPVKEKENNQNETPIKSFKARGGGFRRESKYYSDYKECTNYIRYGYCRFGDRCKYVHPDYDEFSESEASEEEPGLDSPVVSKPNFDFKKKELCRFFKRSGSCFKGDNCNFSHIFSNQKTTDEPLPESEICESSSPSNLNFSTANQLDETSKNVFKDAPICRNYMFYGRCRFGNACKFSHVPRTSKNVSNESKNQVCVEERTTLKEEKELIDDINDSMDIVTMKFVEITSIKIKNNLHLSKKNVVKPLKGNLHLPDLSVDDIHNLRKDEIAYLKRKFQRKIENENENEFEVSLAPTDPDWKFEVKQVKLRLSIPDDYPKEMCSIQCLNEDDVLPLILLRHLNKTIVDWLIERFRIATRNEKVELVFRPFFKWFDRNLEDTFIEGLKKVRRNIVAEAAGIQFIPHEDIAENLKQNLENIAVETMEEPATQIQTETQPDLPLKEKNRIGFPSSTPKIGTEIKLRNLELTENAATLSCRKLALTIQCGRCRLRSDIITPPLRSNNIVCSRCNHTQQVTFRPQLLHQFVAVLGYLDLDDCGVVDMPLSKCDFSIGCLNCNRQADINGLQYGQRQNSWCFYCNSKMTIRIESVKFQYMRVGPINVGSAQVVKLGKKVKNVHDPAIQEGKPLPDNGTCKHYKKSFRWLRFPCCGKAYPCDFCHNDKEHDHEMKFANRMICGFCAKEQPYTNGKDCVVCASNLNKRTGTHWEGGRGCRDKIKMSREDKQKYQGTNKTESKKVQLAKQN